MRPALRLLGPVLALAGTVTCGITASAAAAPNAVQTVSYGGVTVQVPRSWPVLDLAASPRTCVRLDRNAVYLGRPGPDQNCPAHAVGRGDAVVIQPVTATPAAREREADAAAGIGISRVLNRVRVTASYADDDRLAQAIIASATVTDPSAVVPQSRSVSPEDADPSDEADASVTDSSVPDASVPTDSADDVTFDAVKQLLPGRNTFTGKGFDTCAAPSISTMKTWAATSPYHSAGIYIGGSDRACPDGNLDPAWVSLAAGQGWQLFPIYVGRQAPCWDDGSGVKAAVIDTSARSTEGGEAADDAVNRAAHFGLASGTAIYFDMEAYQHGNAACSTDVRAFLVAWTRELHARGFLSGVYSSTSSAIADMSDVYNDFPGGRPDAVWFAHWDSSPSLFGDAYLSDQLWRGHQRAKQFTGGHDETFGGRTIDIDSDVLDAPVAVVGSPLAAPAALPTHAPSMLYDDGKGGSTLYTWTSDGSTFPDPTTSGPYDIDPARTGDRVAVCGFTSDGASDLVSVESDDTGNAVLRVHPGTGSGTFAMTGTTWWTGALPGLATARVAAGDFDGTGRCDVAALVDPGDGGGARIYKWASNGTSFAAPSMWQASASWPASVFSQRIVAGHFRAAGHSDLALGTQNNDGTIDVHVLAAAVGGSDGSPGPSWYHSNQFHLANVGARIVAGEFESDSASGLDGLAMLYDHGNGQSTLFRWQNTGSAFATPDSWNGAYDASTVGPRLAAADITGTGTSAVVAASQRADGTFAFHVWDRASEYEGGDGWYVSGPFPLSSVGGRLLMS